MRIGTRGSALALAQAGWVADRAGPRRASWWRSPPPATGREGWVTSRDGSPSWSRRCSTAGSTSRCIRPRTFRPSWPTDSSWWRSRPRADPRDALCGAADLDALPAGRAGRYEQPATRGAAAARRPDLEVRELRGNVDTRLRKLAAGEADAIVLAAAGLVAARPPARDRRDARRAGAGGRPGRAGHRGAGAGSTLAALAAVHDARRRRVRARRAGPRRPARRELQHPGGRVRAGARRGDARAAGVGRAAGRIGVDRGCGARRRPPRSAAWWPSGCSRWARRSCFARAEQVATA